ncbi:hypothetical protein V8B97DRAFT_2023542 [Scleroderma yunnanense]
MELAHALIVEHARPTNSCANDCVPQESCSCSWSCSTLPTDSQQVSQDPGQRKKITSMVARVHLISSQAKEPQSDLGAQGCLADAPPPSTTPLDPIFELEDAYDSGTDAFQQHVPSVMEYISAIHDSDVEVDGSEGEFNEGTDTDTSLSMDGDEGISEDELDRDIISQKQQPGRPKGSSRPVLTGPVSADEPKTCTFMIQCAVSSDISPNNFCHNVGKKLGHFPGQVFLEY